MSHLSLFFPKHRAVVAVIAILPALSACQKPAEKPAVKAEEKTTSSVAATAVPSSSNSSTVVSDEKPVIYPFEVWQKQPVTSLTLADLTPIKAMLGTVTRTDDKSLDYAGNSATKYSFIADSAPYLDLIDSPQFLELGWYYANPGDSDTEKKQSIANAAKAYTVAQGLLGKPADKLIQAILGGQVIKNQTINDKTVTLAKCEFYSCQLIIKK